MQSVEAMSERIPYWLSLDMQVRGLAEGVLGRFAVTGASASQRHAPRICRVRWATRAFARSRAQEFGRIRGQNEDGRATR